MASNSETTSTPGGRSGKIRFWISYALFAGVVAYGFLQAPRDVWNLSPLSIALAVAAILVQFAFQWWQSQLFLAEHNIRGELAFSGLFTARKSVLNAVLPGKAGTFILMNMLVGKFGLRWRDYLVFMLLATVCALMVSVVGVIFLVLGLMWGMTASALFSAAVFAARRFHRIRYQTILPKLLVSSVGLFVSLMVGFWCVLMGMGWDLGIQQAISFSVVLNVLAQVSVTPANMGVREIVLGVLSPYLALPISAGILAGAVFISIRLAVYGVLLLVFEMYRRK